MRRMFAAPQSAGAAGVNASSMPRAGVPAALIVSMTENYLFCSNMKTIFSAFHTAYTPRVGKQGFFETYFVVGSFISKQIIPSAEVLTETEPLCSSTIRFTIAKPRPFPWVLCALSA